MAKKIDVVNGYALSFEQRARGQESPYFVGTIYKDWVKSMKEVSDA